MKKQIFITLVVLVVCMLTSCKSVQYIPVEHIRDSFRYEKIQDTIIIKEFDSTSLKIKNDTVFLEKYKNLIEWRISHDTLYVTKEEKIPTIQEIEKAVTPTWCWWLLVVFAVFITYKVARVALKIYTRGKI